MEFKFTLNLSSFYFDSLYRISLILLNIVTSWKVTRAGATNKNHIERLDYKLIDNELLMKFIFMYIQFRLL